MRDPGAPNLVLARQTGDVGAGAADPLPLDDSRPSPRLRHMSSQLLATLSAAEDQDFEPFWLRHELPPCATLRERSDRCRVSRHLSCSESSERVVSRILQRQTRPAITPPSTSWIAPVVQLAFFDKRNTMWLARSSGRPTRPIGWKALKPSVSVCSTLSGSMNALKSGVTVTAGATAFTRIP